MTDKTPTALDHLLDQVPVGQAPIGDLLTAGHTAKRRQRRTLIGGVVAATVLVIGGGAMATQVLGDGDGGGHTNESNLTADTTTPKHTVTVQTSLDGPEIYYFEGALTKVSISSENDGDTTVLPTSDFARVGWTDTWADLPEGRYTIAAAVLPCGGNCDALDPPTDSCEQSINLTTRTQIEVTFHYGRPCTITVASDALATPAAQETTAHEPSSTPSFTVYTHCGVENVRIDGRWWHASPPLYDREGSGPPAGWGDPYQEGALTMESADRAVFEALGRSVVFVPAPDNEPVRVCR